MARKCDTITSLRDTTFTHCKQREYRTEEEQRQLTLSVSNDGRVKRRFSLASYECSTNTRDSSCERPLIALFRESTRILLRCTATRRTSFFQLPPPSVLLCGSRRDSQRLLSRHGLQRAVMGR